jgi:hypothetical protein
LDFREVAAKQQCSTSVAEWHAPKVDRKERAMATQTVEQCDPGDRTEAEVDKTVEDTFPASDPPATGGATRIEKTAGSDVPGTEPDEDVPDEDTPGEPSPGDVPPDEPAPRRK